MEFDSALARHIRRKHHTIPEVSQAIKAPTSVRLMCFDMFKKQGILNTNEASIAKGEVVSHREQRDSNLITNEDVVRCSSSNGVYSRKFYSRHKGKCGSAPFPIRINQENIQEVDSLLTKRRNLSKAFLDNVTMRDDDVGLVCKRRNYVIRRIVVV